MKVILLQDVKSVGKKGDTVELSEGYARNFILPRKLGVEATSANMNNLKLQKANEAKIAKEQYEDAVAFSKEIEEMLVKVGLKSGEGGKTFGSISSKEIVTAVKEQYGKEIDKKKLQMPADRLRAAHTVRGGGEDIYPKGVNAGQSVFRDGTH